MTNGVNVCLSFSLNVFTFSSVYARMVYCFCATLTQFLKSIILQGSVAVKSINIWRCE